MFKSYNQHKLNSELTNFQIKNTLNFNPYNFTKTIHKVNNNKFHTSTVT